MHHRSKTPVVSDADTFFLYGRIRKIYFPGAPASPLTLFATLKPEGIGVYSPIIRLKDDGMFGCPTAVAFHIAVPSRQSQFLLVIYEFYPNFGDIEIARLALPLTWFPPGHLISHPFPVVTRQSYGDCPMALLDIHLSRGKSVPFSAPPGKLCVAPTWPIPPCFGGPSVITMEKQAEIPLPDIPPQVKSESGTVHGGGLVLSQLFPKEAVRAWLGRPEASRDE
jgi:hypothetical protein